MYSKCSFECNANKCYWNRENFWVFNEQVLSRFCMSRFFYIYIKIYSLEKKKRFFVINVTEDQKRNYCEILLMSRVSCLKLVSATLYQIFIFSPNDSSSKTMENVFYFIQNALFILEIFNLLYFFPFLSTLFRHKMTNGSGIIYDDMNWLA